MAKSTLIDRRRFMQAAGIAFLSGLNPRALFALEKTDAVFASAYRAADGSYGIATLSERGEILSRDALPARAHGMAVSPARAYAVAFARRPGTFAMALDLTRRAEPVTIAAPEGRHFFGHGCFSPDGRWLYASENDFDGNRGVIGLYDANENFARIGEYDAHGIGTHDLAISEDGAMLIAANGGIETHPDFGRTKLNLDRMEPSLSLIDARSGALIERHTLPESLRRLSTRHIDLDAEGHIWFACQYEGPRNDAPPLVGHFGRGETLTFLDLPEEASNALGNYVGAIAVNRTLGLVGVTSPVGGAAITFDAASGQMLALRRLDDAAGIAPAQKGFAVSSYDGQFLDARQDVAWDQHILRLTRHL